MHSKTRDLVPTINHCHVETKTQQHQSCHGSSCQAESYGYCWGQAVDLSPVMPAAQFHVTNERGTYLCTVRALVFEGSILTYNPALNEAKWIPARGLANDLSWG